MTIQLILSGITISIIAGFSIHSILHRAARPSPVLVPYKTRPRK
jgi:hypothetical protein